VLVPFIHYDDIDPEYVTPQHSAAYGPLATGAAIEVGILSFNAGEQARPHQHPNEQIVIVLQGRVRVRLGDEEQELGPRSGYLAPSGLSHGMTALTDVVLLSCKNLVDGKGHRI
jgi:quercetin dioxygenase-like cupin family protein